jgi:hypothetical protein
MDKTPDLFCTLEDLVLHPLPWGEFRHVNLACVQLHPFYGSLFANPEYLSEGWPNEIGPKATRSNIRRSLDKHYRHNRIVQLRLKTQVSRDAELGDGHDGGSCNARRVLSATSDFRPRVNIAFTVPKGMAVCFAIRLAPNAFSRFSVRTWQIVASGSGGLPSRLPFARAVLSPIIVRSDILAVSCLARVANIETITSLNGPVESSHCS